jgi:hypothetical protein
MKTSTEKAVQISRPNFARTTLVLRGTAPFVANNFSHEARELMRAKQAAGSTGKKGTKREAKDFDACYRGSMHVTQDGKPGINSTAFRQAMISACRLVGFKMTMAKLAFKILPDAYDIDGCGIVLFTKGLPVKVEHAVRNETGVADIRARAMWEPGWEARLTVEYDQDMFTLADLVNLVWRAGAQVGIGAGRPDSHDSAGQGWGLFEVAT